MVKRAISNQPSEERRFEVLLEEIRGQLKLICEAQAASVTRDEALDAKIEKMRSEFYSFVSNVHDDLARRDKELDTKIETLDVKVDKFHAELMKEIREIKEILLIHDKRISAVEHI